MSMMGTSWVDGVWAGGSWSVGAWAGSSSASTAVTSSGAAGVSVGFTPAAAAGTAWNKDWAKTYGPDAERARSARQKELQRAKTTLSRADRVPEISDIQALAKRSLTAELMSDEADKVVVMLAYYELLRWRKRMKADDEKAAELLLL